MVLVAVYEERSGLCGVWRGVGGCGGGWVSDKVVAEAEERKPLRVPGGVAAD